VYADALFRSAIFDDSNSNSALLMMGFLIFEKGEKMKTDFYTKLVLTVIACCLVWQNVDHFVPVAEAQNSRPLKVTICDLSGYRCADIKNIPGMNDGLVVSPQ
jgi:hypothetical protein